MTWEEIIIQIRKDSRYRDLVEKAYFEEDLKLNVERFRNSEEFIETKVELRTFFSDLNGKRLLDLGAGNGIASLSFALAGLDVCAVEPDPSLTIGSGAIKELESIYKTGRVQVTESFGEDLPFENGAFDIVYIRQAMHHARDLENFVKQCSRVLKKGGLFVSVRDHVVYDASDKQLFLDTHPLHKFYGGENAFTFTEYKSAIESANLRIQRYYKHYESVINYFPETKDYIEKKKMEWEKNVSDGLAKKLPSFIAKVSLLRKPYASYLEKKLGKILDETKVPGRHISFFATKE